jgi:hypothetical protein
MYLTELRQRLQIRVSGDLLSTDQLAAINRFKQEITRWEHEQRRGDAG